jgi:hypothetical protein
MAIRDGNPEGRGTIPQNRKIPYINPMQFTEHRVPCEEAV